MKVSVIIPVYNGKKTIKKCIESVISQTLDDIEIIVVNDGSTDFTEEVLQSFSGIKIIKQENRGQGFARNAGLDAASGGYVGFVDADDTIEPQMYEKMYDAAIDTGAQIVQCNLTDVYPNGEKRTQLSKFEGTIDVFDNAEYMAEYMAEYIHSYEVCNKLFKREFIEENRLRFEDTKKYFSEDILFNMEAVKNLKRICFIKEAYYNYCQHEDSHMHASAEERLGKMMRLFEDYLNSVSGKMKSSASYLASMVTLYNMGKCGDRAQLLMAAKWLGEKIRDALKAKCSFKKRMYLTAVLCSPLKLRVILAKLSVRN